VKAAPFGQRRPARRREAALIQEAEAGLLGGALVQWQVSAEAVAASAVEVHLAERRLLLAAARRAWLGRTGCRRLSGAHHPAAGLTWHWIFARLGLPGAAQRLVCWVAQRMCRLQSQ